MECEFETTDDSIYGSVKGEKCVEFKYVEDNKGDLVIKKIRFMNYKLNIEETKKLFFDSFEFIKNINENYRIKCKSDFINSFIELPQNEIVERCVKLFDKEQKLSEQVVQKVFKNFDNSSVDNIMLKCIVLNNRYSAGLTDNVISEEKKEKYKKDKKLLPVDLQTMSEHIWKCFNNNSFEPNTIKDMVSIVNKIGYLGDEYEKVYVFASKYCAWTYRNIDVPIMDSKVKGLLYKFNRMEKFYDNLKREDLDDYGKFVCVYKKFVEKYDFEGEGYKKVDKYLWQYAKNIEREIKKEYGIDVVIL